jgi:hypothetical protein
MKTNEKDNISITLKLDIMKNKVARLLIKVGTIKIIAQKEWLKSLEILMT